MEDPKKAAIRREFGRKPYMPALGDPNDPQSELSQMERMRRVPNKAIFDQRDEAHSEFLKPYLSDDYQAMEHWYPPPFPNFAYPGSPNFQLPEFGGVVPGWGDDAWGLGKITSGPCSIHCHGNYVGKDCSQPIKCGWLAMTPPETAKGWTLTKESGAVVAIGKIIHEGAVTPIKIYPSEGSWANYVDSGKTFVTLKVWFYDAGGTVCTDEVTVYCNPCPPDVAISWNGTPPATIDAGGNVAIAVSGGEDPYTYVVTGTGYTWNINGSATLVSNSQTVQLDCAAGT